MPCVALRTVDFFAWSASSPSGIPIALLATAVAANTFWSVADQNGPTEQQRATNTDRKAGSMSLIGALRMSAGRSANRYPDQRHQVLQYAFTHAAGRSKVMAIGGLTESAISNEVA